MGYNFFFENFWFNIFLKHDSQSCDVFCIFRWATPLYVTLRVCPKVEFCLCILFVPTLFVRFNAPPPIRAFCLSPLFVYFVHPHQVTGTPGHRNTGTMEHRDTKTLQHQDTGHQGTGTIGGFGVPTYHKRVVILPRSVPVDSSR